MEEHSVLFIAHHVTARTKPAFEFSSHEFLMTIRSNSGVIQNTTLLLRRTVAPCPDGQTDALSSAMSFGHTSPVVP